MIADDDRLRQVIIAAAAAFVIVLLLELIDDLAWRIDRVETIVAKAIEIKGKDDGE